MTKQYAPTLTANTRNLNAVLSVGSKSIRYQLNEWSEATEKEWPSGRPVGDAGRSLDSALRAARRKARRSSGSILLVAYQWVSSEGGPKLIFVGTVFEITASFTN